MRWLVLSLVLATGFVAWVTVTALRSGPEPSPDAVSYHEPATDEERALAAHVLRYVGALQANSAERACAFAAGRVALLLRCHGGRPRVPGELFPNAGTPRVFDIHLHDAEARLDVGGIDGGSIAIYAQRIRGRWKVVRQYGYALM